MQVRFALAALMLLATAHPLPRLASGEIRGALSQYIVDELYVTVDVAAQIQERLPDQLGAQGDLLLRGGDERLDLPRRRGRAQSARRC